MNVEEIVSRAAEFAERFESDDFDGVTVTAREYLDWVAGYL